MQRKPRAIMAGLLGCWISLASAQADQPMLAGVRLISAGNTPGSTCVGDFNHDGKPDLATVNVSYPGGIVTLLGNGDGTYQSAVTNPAAPFLQGIVCADLNRDNNLDLVANGNAEGVWWLAGNGDGTFATAQKVTGPAGLMAAVGNLNGDSSPDLVTESGSTSIAVRLGNGDGTFQTATIIPISYTANPDFVAIQDMNHDGINDIVAASDGYSSGIVSVLLGNGDGTFKSPVNTSVGTYNYALAVGDFNDDGTNDVAVTDYNAGVVNVLLNRGDGSLHLADTQSVGAQAQTVATGDFNRDGKADLAVAAGTNSMVLLGNGNGTFNRSARYDWLRNAVMAVDVNGDGLTDLVVDTLNNAADLAVALGNGDGTFQAAQNYGSNLSPNSLALGDLNGDGKPELVVGNSLTNFISVLANNGHGQFVSQSNYPAGTNCESVAIADFVNRGTNDVVVANLNSPFVSLLRGNGDGTLQNATTAAAVTIGSSYVLATDFNGDGTNDLAVLGLFGLSEFQNKGDGTFKSAITTAGPFELDQMAAADLNNDGTNDIAFDAYGGNYAAVMQAKGNGQFISPYNYFAGTNAQAIAVGDFDGDGTNDLVVATAGNAFPRNGVVAVLRGTGNGTFAPPVNCLTNGNFSAVAVADFNSDGHADLAVADATANDVQVLLGKGDGSFGAPAAFAVMNDPVFLAVGDINGDGHPDLAVGNLSSGCVSILMNTYTMLAPLLSNLPISPGDQSITFTWPVSAASYALQTISELASGNWQTASGTRVTNQNNIQVTIPTANGMHFFRLYKQP